MKIRDQLAWMILAALIPVLIAIGIGTALLLQNERRSIERDAVGRTRSAMSAIDSEVRSAIDTMRAIATSRALANGEMSAFYEDARHALESQPHWFNLGLTTATGEAIFDARSPFDSPASRRAEEAFTQAVQTRKATIGNVALGRATNQQAIRLHLPIEQDNELKFVLTAVIDPASFTRVLQAQQMPADWIIALVDRSHHFIARIPTQPVGNPISQTFRDGLQKSPEGFIEGRTTEGIASYTPYVTSPLTGWVLGIAIPRSVVNAGAWNLLPSVLLGIAFATAVAIGVGRLMGRRIAAPVAALAAGATAIQRGDSALPPVRSKIAEIAELDHGLRDAAAAVQARELEARKAQEALRRSEQRYRTLVASLPETAVYLVDRDLRYLMAEGEALAAAGLQQSDLEGKTLDEALPPSLASELIPLYRRALDGDTFTLEHSAYGRHYVLHGAPIRSDDGGVDAALAVSHDVTDRRQASDLISRQREELQTMLDLMPVGVGIAHDPRAEKISIAPRFAELLGPPPGSTAPLSGQWVDKMSYRFLRNGQPLAPEQLPMQRAARTGIEVRDVEFDVQRADGSILNLMASAAPLFDATGSVRGAIGAHVDVTPLKRIQRELEAADRRKDEFLATLAHELRNPMAPIRYAAALLQTDASPAAVEKARRTIERQASLMSRLLDDLLDMSRITRNAIELKPERVDLRLIAQESIDIARPFIASMQHQVIVSLPGAPLWVEGDPTRLLQIFGNLLTNAAKFSESGGSVEMVLLEQDGYAVAQVHDTGIGLAPSMLTAVFDLFSQVHKEQRIESGLGIGLSVVKRLVEMHGGSIRATSDGLGRGATFMFSLPLATASERIGPAIQDAATVLLSRGTRVLVVDDNADTADTLELVLASHGLDVQVARDGRSALARAAEFQPHTVVLDLGLPDMGGDDVARALRAQSWSEAMYLIAVTGWGQEQDRIRTAAAGFDLHLVKPVDPNELLRLISLHSAREAEPRTAGGRV